MPSLIQNIAKRYLRDFKDNDLRIMLEDCKEQEYMNYLYGDEEIDKPRWLAWRQSVVEEMERRGIYGKANTA